MLKLNLKSAAKIILILAALFSGSLTMAFAESLTVGGGIVPHHGPAEPLVQDFYKTLKTKAPAPSRIILIGPDHQRSLLKHFGTGRLQKKAVTSNAGLINDETMIARLAALPYVEKAESVLGVEHAVMFHKPWLAQYFPGVPVTPLLIKEGAPDMEITALAAIFAEEIERGALLILSSDFSHNLTAAEAALKDKYNLEAIASFNPLKLSRMNTDCWQGARLLTASLKKAGFTQMNLLGTGQSAPTEAPPETLVVTYATIIFSSQDRP